MNYQTPWEKCGVLSAPLTLTVLTWWLTATGIMDSQVQSQNS